MEATTKPSVPVDVPEGADFAFAIAVFYCRRSEHARIAGRLQAEKNAELTPRFNHRTGEPMPAEVKWTENGVKCSLEPAPIFHRLYDDEAQS